MPAGPVVLNNTPLVALSAVGRLDLLRDLFGEVLIPEAVRAEFLAVDAAQREAVLEASAWVGCVPLKFPRRVLSYGGLDTGEAEVLALAEEVDSRLVVIDERKARRYAQRLGIPLTGTVGLLLLAKERALLEAVGPWLTRLQATGLHLDPVVTKKALQLAGEGSGM